MNDTFNKTQFLYSTNATFIADLYKQYLQNPSSIANEWREIFNSFSNEEKIDFETDFFGPSWQKRNLNVISQEAKIENQSILSKVIHTKNTDSLREKFIQYGHISANINPIIKNINPLHEEILNNLPHTPSTEEEKLKNLYCHSVGVEFAHISDKIEKEWLISRYESIILSDIDIDERKDTLVKIIQAENFEQFIHKKFPGMKRFSIEGGEASLAIANIAILESAKYNITDIIIGMAHRGRLNMLANITKKPIEMMFSEFLKTIKVDENLEQISSDVKYHAGYKTTYSINNSEVNVEIAYNPSHLEAVNPVVLGSAYAKNKNGNCAMPLLIHGDAAMMGQGVVAECFNMSSLKHYNTNGTLHLVINNQIGFTAESFESRSSRYCTDIAKMIECPIFHINGDDIDSCIKITKLAIEYRIKFKKDVVLDIICSRKYGHNEGDEPFYTNPTIYNILKNKESSPVIYQKKLIQDNLVNENFIDEVKFLYNQTLEEGYKKAENGYTLFKNLEKEFDNLSYKFSFDKLKTGINEDLILELLKKCYTMPEDFTPNSRLAKQIESRLEMTLQTKQLDWAAGEILAFSSLIHEGNSVRITGQDSERGTFSHRHSVLTDLDNGRKYNILSPLKSNKAEYEVCNSPLSEYAVLGFEYGYSLINPQHLTIWEAQFGDFSNGASTIFDQFISSAEQKWLLMSGLTLLLPHGFEGQGPEHSSARLERYLQSCAQNNIIVANCTTPANLFHILRRQIFAQFRKPLIIMSPKSLLRHKFAISNITEFTENSSFQTIIGESRNSVIDKKVEKIIITSGKIYYELLEKSENDKTENVAIIRIEQYYPFDSKVLKDEILKYKNIKYIYWVQEEPQNMGAWFFIRDYLESAIEKLGIKIKLRYIGRPTSASPATGFEKVHQYEQKTIIKNSFS